MSKQFSEYVELVAAVKSNFDNWAPLERYLAINELKRRLKLELNFLDAEMARCEAGAMEQVRSQGRSVHIEEASPFFGPVGRAVIYERRKSPPGFTVGNLVRWLTTVMPEEHAKQIVDHCCNARKAEVKLIPKVPTLTRVCKMVKVLPGQNH